MVYLVVLGELALEQRPDKDQVEYQSGQDDGRYEDFEGDVVAKAMEGPRRPYSKCAVEETHVPVGLDGVGDSRRVVGTELPDRVDLSESTEQRGDAADDEEESCGLGDEDRVHRRADDVLLGATAAGELRVLLANQQEEVRTH